MLEPTGDITTNTWTYENQLSQVELPDDQIITYLYAPTTRNSDELRISREDEAGTVHYLWDAENIIRELDDTLSLQAAYTLAPMPYGDLVSQNRDGDTSFYLYDGLGSTRQLTDDSQTTTDQYDYSAYGVSLGSTGSTANNFQYIGELQYYKDEVTGTYSLRRREYETGLARFLSEDPAQSDPNLYWYAEGNPLEYTDPSGEICIKCYYSHPSGRGPRTGSRGSDPSRRDLELSIRSSPGKEVDDCNAFQPTRGGELTYRVPENRRYQFVRWEPEQCPDEDDTVIDAFVKGLDRGMMVWLDTLTLGMDPWCHEKSEKYIEEAKQTRDWLSRIGYGSGAASATAIHFLLGEGIGAVGVKIAAALSKLPVIGKAASSLINLGSWLGALPAGRAIASWGTKAYTLFSDTIVPWAVKAGTAVAGAAAGWEAYLGNWEKAIPLATVSVISAVSWSQGVRKAFSGNQGGSIANVADEVVIEVSAEEKIVATAIRSDTKTFQDFLDEAETRLQAIKAEYGGVDATMMSKSRADSLSKMNSLVP